MVGSLIGNHGLSQHFLILPNIYPSPEIVDTATRLVNNTCGQVFSKVTQNSEGVKSVAVTLEPDVVGTFVGVIGVDLVVPEADTGSMEG